MDTYTKLLIEKLERVSGKKVVLENNLFSSIETVDTLKEEVIKEMSADTATLATVLQQYVDNLVFSTSEIEVVAEKITAILHVSFHTNDIYNRVFKSTNDLKTFLKPKLLASRIVLSDTKGRTPGVTGGLQYTKILQTKKEQWEVVFSDSGDNEVVVNQKFNTEDEAKTWADALEYDFQDEWFNPESNDYEFKTFYRYYNPEDKESSYVSYEVRLVQ